MTQTLSSPFDPEPSRKSTLQLPRVRQLSKRIRRDTYDLCQPEGRMVGSPGHDAAETFVRRRLAEAGCRPYRDDTFDLPYYSGSGLEFRNLVGVIPGKDASLAPILIGAHYDSVIAAPCADDNGAAVAASLAVADSLRNCGGLNRDVIIAIFDAEEPPYFLGSDMGSFRFYHEQMDSRGVHFALILDMISHDVSIPVAGIDLPIPLLKDALFVMGAESHPELSRAVANTGSQKGIKLAATLNQYVGDMSDHAVFRQSGTPYLFLSCGLWAHYHQPSDTPDRLNYTKTARVARLCLKILHQVSECPLHDGGSMASDDHTLDFEVETFKKLVGPALPLVLRWAGLRKLESRADIEQMVGKLTGAGLAH